MKNLVRMIADYFRKSEKSMAENTPEEVVLIDKWDSLENELLGLLDRNNYGLSEVVVRQSSRDRLQRALLDGTDRDKKSSVWNHPGDAAHTGKTDPVSIIYAWAIDISKTPFRRIPYVGNNPGNDYIPDWKDEFTSKDMIPGQILLVYRTGSLERKSDYEFAFRAKPKQALIGIIAKKEDVERPNMSYYFDTGSELALLSLKDGSDIHAAIRNLPSDDLVLDKATKKFLKKYS